MFERFTEKSIKVIMLAQEEARRLGHNYVGTGFILLGLIGVSDGIAGRVLKSQGVTLRNARQAVEARMGRGDGKIDVEMPFTASAKLVLEQSWNEARETHVNYIGTEHLLLGLISGYDNTGIRTLEDLGVDTTKIRSLVAQQLEGTAPNTRVLTDEQAKIIARIVIQAFKDSFNLELFQEKIKEGLVIGDTLLT